MTGKPHPNIDPSGLPGHVAGIVSVTDVEILDYFEHCVTICADQFRQRESALPQPFRVLLGETGPEYRMESGGGTPSIILNPDSDEWQMRVDAGHEVFHWLRTPADAYPGVFHWTHEMLANEISLRCLRTWEATWRPGHAPRDYGPVQHAQKFEAWLEAKASEVSLELMLTTRLQSGVPYKSVYGRAFLTGRLLQKAVGWERLKPLAVREPDVRGWLEALPSKLNHAAIDVLGKPSDEWV